MEDNQGIYIDLKNFPYYKHPIYNNYAANKFGIIFNINTNKRQIPIKISGHLKKCPKSKLKNHQYIRLDYYSRCEVDYLLNQFIWECFNGILKPGNMIISINGSKELQDLKCIKYDYNFNCKC